MGCNMHLVTNDEVYITTMPPHMLMQVVDMIRFAEYCPDALMKSISLKNNDDPDFVQWMFRAFGGKTASDLAINTINYYKKHF